MTDMCKADSISTEPYITVFAELGHVGAMIDWSGRYENAVTKMTATQARALAHSLILAADVVEAQAPTDRPMRVGGGEQA